MHFCTQTPPTPSHTQTLLSLQAVTDCSVFTVERQIRSHPLHCVSLHHWKCTISSRVWRVGVLVGLQCRQSAAPVFQLHLSLLSCIWGVKRSRGQQRNTGYLAFVEDWTKACVRGFSTTCPALSSALYYRLIPCAVDFCPLCHIKGKGLRMGKCRSCGVTR